MSAPRLSRVERAALHSIAAQRWTHVGPYRVMARILERRGLMRVVRSARNSARVTLTAAGWVAAADWQAEEVR